MKKMKYLKKFNDAQKCNCFIFDNIRWSKIAETRKSSYDRDSPRERHPGIGSPKDSRDLVTTEWMNRLRGRGFAYAH